MISKEALKEILTPLIGVILVGIIIIAVGWQMVIALNDPDYIPPPPPTYWHGIPPFFILIGVALILSLILGAASWIYNWRLKRKEAKK